jgi:uncharacterized membrane protein YdjX (TVP38/TMEM64 family)
MSRRKTKSLIELCIIIFLFILFSFIIQKNVKVITSFIGMGVLSMLVYVLIVILAIVVAPVSAMPLVPVASNVWGWVVAALLSIVAWTIGALLAFIIARRFGVPLVRKFISLEKIARFEAFIPQQNIFWMIVFLRMVLPVDVLSYALGLFSTISVRKYFFATIIGVAPFALVFAYVGKMPFTYQIIALGIAIILFFPGWRLIYKRM